MTRLEAGGHADDAGRYLLESRIATGGMGEVWRARDTVLDRAVAVKVLKPEYADDALFRTRFETEARHAASLHHPGVASVFDFGQASPADGSGTPRPYLVMELVDGQPLSALLRPSAPLDPEAARDLLAQAADALGAAHRSGIVHRDVKPANLIVTPDRRVKVTDFGIARAAEGMALTETGQVLGTPAYISPEQAEGSSATAASDVYALGVVAFECLAGARPFSGETPVATAIAHLRNPVPPLPGTVPADLAAVVMRALSKAPADRYPDGAALARALRSGDAGAAAVGPAVAAPATTQVLPAAGAAAAPLAAPAAEALPAATTTGAGVPPDPDPGDRRRRSGPPWALVAALAAVVVALVLAVWIGSRDDDPAADPASDRTPGASTDPSREQSPTPSGTATDSPSETPTETPSETPTQTPTETETAETVVVDPAAYLGRGLEDVTNELEALDLVVEEQELENPGDQGEGVVASVDPSGEVEVGTTVVVGYYGPVLDDGNNGGGNDPGDEDGGESGQGNGGGNGNGNGNGKGNGKGKGGKG